MTTFTTRHISGSCLNASNFPIFFFDLILRLISCQPPLLDELVRAEDHMSHEVSVRSTETKCPATAAAILRSAAVQLKEMRSAWRMLRWAGLRASRNASVGSAEDLHCNLPIRYARPCEGRAHIIQRLSVLMGPGADLDYTQMYSKPTAIVAESTTSEPSG